MQYFECSKIFDQTILRNRKSLLCIWFYILLKVMEVFDFFPIAASLQDFCGTHEWISFTAT